MEFIPFSAIEELYHTFSLRSSNLITSGIIYRKSIIFFFDVYALSRSGTSAVPSLIKLGESGNTEAEIMLLHYEFPKDIFEAAVPDFIAKMLLKK